MTRAQELHRLSNPNGTRHYDAVQDEAPELALARNRQADEEFRRLLQHHHPERATLVRTIAEVRI